MIEPLVRTILASNEAVKTITAERIYFAIKPQNERRASIVITLVSDQHFHCFDGRLPYTKGTLQLDCFASTYEAAKNLAAAVRDALDAPQSPPIDWIDIEATQDIYAEPLEGEAEPLYGVSIDAEFMLQEQDQ